MRAVLLAVLCLCGCTSLRPVEPGAVAAVLAEIQVGDRISVRTAAAWYDGFTVTALTESELEGEIGPMPMTIRRDDVLELRVPRAALGKTVGLAIGVVYATLGVLVFFFI